MPTQKIDIALAICVEIILDFELAIMTLIYRHGFSSWNQNCVKVYSQEGLHIIFQERQIVNYIKDFWFGSDRNGTVYMYL